MSIQVKEVHKFDKGLHGSISETDISSESASLSLNIDPNSEYGTLRGIYGDKILGTSGWEPPRRPTWSIVFFSSITDKILKLYFEKRCFMINAYDTQSGPNSSTAAFQIVNNNNFGIAIGKAVYTNVALSEGDMMMLDTSVKSIDNGTNALCTVDIT